MLEWINIFFTSASIFLQLMLKKEKHRLKDPFIAISFKLSKKLKDSKEVHAGLQELYYEQFKQYLSLLDTEYTVHAFKEGWENNYNWYKKLIIDHEIDSIRDQKIEPIKVLEIEIEKIYNKNKKFEKIIEKKKMKSFVKSYTIIIYNLNLLDNEIEDVNKNISDGNTDSKLMKKIDNYLHTILLHADRSIKTLIDIQDRLISQMDDTYE